MVLKTASLLMVDIWSAGFYGADEERTHATCPSASASFALTPTDNGYARPIEALRPVVEPEHNGSDSH